MSQSLSQIQLLIIKLPPTLGGFFSLSEDTMSGILGVAMSKSALVDAFREILKEDEHFACHALSLVYKKQTEDEKQTESVNHNNGVGFRAEDAKFLSSLAAQLERKGGLSEKQMEWLFKKMPVYAAQVVNIMLNEHHTIKQDKAGVYWW